MPNTIKGRTEFTFTFDPKENPGLRARLDEFAKQLADSSKRLQRTLAEPGVIHVSDPRLRGTMTCSVASGPSEAE